MPLDLSSLRSAVAALQRALGAVERAAQTPELDEAFHETLRAGVVQCFEFTYELCWKFIQRWLRLNRSPTDADHPRTRKELFRVAARCGLVADPVPWFRHAEARNLTAHTYDATQAERVYAAAVGFVDDARYLLRQLEASND